MHAPKDLADLAKLIREMAKQRGKPFKYIVIHGHCGGRPRAAEGGPGVMIDFGDKKLRLDLDTLRGAKNAKDADDLIKAIREGLAPDGELVIIACGHLVSDPDDPNDRVLTEKEVKEWEKKLQDLATLLQRRVTSSQGPGLLLPVPPQRSGGLLEGEEKGVPSRPKGSIGYWEDQPIKRPGVYIRGGTMSKPPEPGQ